MADDPGVRLLSDFPSENDRTAVRMERGAIRVTAEGPEDRALFRNDHAVLDGATDVLGSRCATLRECRFTATELARSLRNMLDLVDPADADEDA